MHYVNPTEDNHKQTARMKERGLFTSLNAETGRSAGSRASRAIRA